MKYCDLHSDALTKEGVLCCTRENLTEGNCLLQCFAAFIGQKEGRFARAMALCDQFERLCRANGYRAVTRCSEVKFDKINALLTVEEGGAIEGDLKKLNLLYKRGVRMMTLTWNYPNEIGFPSVLGYKSGQDGLTMRERKRGLTSFGEQVVERMNELGMVIDVSHGSDRLLADVLYLSRQPIVASHSNARRILDCARNLSDAQIKAIAQNGGVVGLNFCAYFLSAEKSAEEQKNAILAHARAIVNAGGEDCLAFGSDFDGIPQNSYMSSPSKMPLLLDLFVREFGNRATEKFANENFLRVFRQVCG